MSSYIDEQVAKQRSNARIQLSSCNKPAAAGHRQQTLSASPHRYPSKAASARHRIACRLPCRPFVQPPSPLRSFGHFSPTFSVLVTFILRRFASSATNAGMELARAARATSSLVPVYQSTVVQPSEYQSGDPLLDFVLQGGCATEHSQFCAVSVMEFATAHRAESLAAPSACCMYRSVTRPLTGCARLGTISLLSRPR